MCGGEAALSTGLKLPLQLASDGVNGVEITIEAAEVDEAGRDGRR